MATSAEIRYELEPYSYPEMRAIAAGLELPEPVAIALVRRGHRTVDQARRFLEADERHPASALAHAAEAAEITRAAIDAGARITVHGDYDVDGICASAILVSCLRRAGAECDWIIPSRITDSYGLSAATIETLAARETELLITADCGIGSVEEVALATEAGIEVIVTDHHQPGGELPACPIIHPGLGGYPFEHLCGAAVAWKLVEAIEGAPRERDLDLVALATIADMVPLVGENRALARAGMAELRRARRPGIAALMAEAKVEPEHLDEGDIGFRLAPRLNAAGRLYRADAGVELMLATEREPARRIAAELSAANHERREVERGVLAEAEAALRSRPESEREAGGMVLAGEGWHPGVVGIVASRMAERHGKPAILVAIDDEGKGKGSGRSSADIDLLAALEASSEHLLRYGGHKAAAGLEIAAERIDDFREQFLAACERARPKGEVAASERIDAVVGSDSLDLDVAEALGRLGPFGQGNPGVRLLVPWAQVGDVRPMGEEGQHARFSLKLGARPARGVAFNSRAVLESAQLGARDLTVRLELNRWNGATEPRAVLSAARDLAPEQTVACGCPGELDAGWWRRFEEGWSAEPGAVPSSGGGVGREVVSSRDRSVVALIAELVSSGSRVLAVCADARRRSELASVAASPARFGGSHEVVCADCPDDLLAADEGAVLVLSEWEAVVRAEAAGALAGFEQVIAVDPPRSEMERRWVEGSGSGYLHLAWTAGGDDLAETCWDRAWELRADLAEIYRAAAAGASSSEVLGGAGSHRRAASVSARCIRVLSELGLVALEGQGLDRTVRVVSSERTDLNRSPTYRAYLEHHRKGRTFLQSQRAEH